ncbi:TIGR03087 family PEP-CTERM/XrtA system glycosyltransferase [Falsiroseomonas tokyonensis]|uniref:TIGR03087 family PEP-CTERM/XrtA system glycosyltransferase n=1 Tax=Falsiroseomonas tokyonensis TaxID=430521 RepID=A0ABV7BMD9_9PROT|nr:TIGR03087 family PEP-CTERM/XrtA system glycosyltransferase [Falsiroseomonas tokyonensis]MBU8536715.1 TIGR03087 family PEP-CTERM/XrtA system glycosyltransferase [Falsiroseomonas tokyonensis]
MRPRLLFLCHRIPYPPDKGDKIRAWHMLDRLAESWDIDLGCLVDDPADLRHLPVLQARCASVEVRETGSRRQAAVRALLRCRPGLPLSLGWFHEQGLWDWTQAQLATRQHQAIFVYSSAMAPYVMGTEAQREGTVRVLDMVDVDSEKWRAYAADAKPPMRQVWAREARTLRAFERRAAAAFDRTLLVSAAEAAQFRGMAPEVAARVDHVDNGVDLSAFDPSQPTQSPYAAGSRPIVFTGTMDYRPNIEAVSWFATQVMPLLADLPGVEFHIVGANPAPAVRALAALPGVHVAGAVPRIQPWIAHAACAVAPLRIARGIQNKVLEAMAMARPVVASPEAFEGVRALPGRDILVAEDAEAMAEALRGVLAGRHPGLGARARSAVTEAHDWRATLRRLDAVLPVPRVRVAA